MSPASPSPAASPLPALVGQWRLNRTCEAIVAALLKTHHEDLIPRVIGEVVNGTSRDGTLPASWDPAHPCADGKVVPHSHTFWPDGRFNSYDELEREVDDDTWAMVDGTTIAIGTGRFRYAADADALTMDPLDPPDCTSDSCLADLGWAYSVASPGQTWTRMLLGEHVPAGSGG